MTDILERVRKLHAAAEGAKAIGSLHEAEAFAVAVQKMLLKYKLDMSDVLIHGATTGSNGVDYSKIEWDKYGIPKHRRRCGWVELLAHGVTEALHCTFLVHLGSNTITVVGRSPDRDLAAYLVGTLTAKAIELVSVASSAKGGGYRNSWLLGFAYGITGRMEKEFQKTSQTDARYALMRVNDKAQLEEFLASTSFSKRRRGPSIQPSRSDAARAGAEAARQVNLKQTGVGNGAGQRKLEGAANG